MDNLLVLRVDRRQNSTPCKGSKRISHLSDTLTVRH